MGDKLASNTISLYDEKILDYLIHDLWIDYNGDVRHPNIYLAMPGTKGNPNLQLSDNNTPILPMITVVRRSIETNEQSHIIKTHIPKLPLYTTMTENRKWAKGSDFMPYTFNYDVDIWSLTQRTLLDIVNHFIWKFMKEPSFSVRGIFSDRNVDIPGYVETYSFNDQSPYEEIGNEEDRILRGTFTLRIYGQMVKEQNPIQTIHNYTDKILVEDPNVIDEGCYNGNSGGDNANPYCGNFKSEIIMEHTIEETIDDLNRKNIAYGLITTTRDWDTNTITFTEETSKNSKNISKKSTNPAVK